MNDAPQRPILSPETIPVQPPAAPYSNVVKVPQMVPNAPRWPIYFFVFAVLLAAVAAVPFVFPGVGALLRDYIKGEPEKIVQTQPPAPQPVAPQEFTQRSARAAALKAVVEAEGPQQIRARAETLSIVDARTITTDYGWIFFWNTKTFIETNDIRAALPGTGPVVVTKKGDVEFLPTNKPPVEAIIEYEVRIGVRQAVIELTATSTNAMATTTATTTSGTATTSAATAATSSVQ